MQVQPYLFFEGRTVEAIAFYEQAIGAKVEMLLRYKDGPESPKPDDPQSGYGSMNVDPEKVMHAALRVGDALVMVSDGRNSGTPEFKGVALSLRYAIEAEARKVFNALAEGGQVQQPLIQTFFSPAFGMLTDRFGVMWMVLADSGQ